MSNVRWECRALLILSLSVLSGAAHAQRSCPAGPMQFCWEINNPTITLRSMRLSLISALVMGSQGYSGWTSSLPSLPAVPSWQTTYTNACRDRSIAVREREGITHLKWFDGLSTDYQECNPEGAIRFINAETGQNWHWASYARTEPTKILDTIFGAIKQYGSPVVIPYLGRWDHWITIVQILLDNRTPDEFELNQFVFFDNLLDLDLSGGGRVVDITGSPRVTASGDWFFLAYARILTAMYATCSVDHSCATKKGDPWYDRYVALYATPTLFSPLASLESNKKYSFTAAPGVVGPGEKMSAALATSRVWDSVRLAQKHSGSSVGLLSDAAADPAVLVSGFGPSGQPLNYYLIALRNPQNQLSGIVQVSAANGAFEFMVDLPNPIKFNPISIQEARQTASQVLTKEETLDAGRTTWDAREFVDGASSPATPYYEFKITGPEGRDAGVVVRVVRHTGALVGRQALSSTR